MQTAYHIGTFCRCSCFNCLFLCLSGPCLAFRKT
uniref:Uncharacterized protein n=1 Tax=Anguilla anguilla TaxID=7936 RepID=A0A0E9SKW0_ANGAN